MIISNFNIYIIEKNTGYISREVIGSYLHQTIILDQPSDASFIDLFNCATFNSTLNRKGSWGLPSFYIYISIAMHQEVASQVVGAYHPSIFLYLLLCIGKQQVIPYFSNLLHPYPLTQKRFYTRETLWSIRISLLAKIPTIYQDWLRLN